MALNLKALCTSAISVLATVHHPRRITWTAIPPAPNLFTQSIGLPRWCITDRTGVRCDSGHALSKDFAPAKILHTAAHFRLYCINYKLHFKL